MAYATFKELKSSYGENRVRHIFAKQTEENLEDYVERKLEAGAGIIDSYLAKIYTTPIDVSIPVPGDPDMERKKRLAAMFSEMNICISLYKLTTGSAELRDSIRDHYMSCLDFLERIMTGELSLPGVTQSRKIFSVVGPCGAGSLADDPLLRRVEFGLHRHLEDFENN